MKMSELRELKKYHYSYSDIKKMGLTTKDVGEPDNIVFINNQLVKLYDKKRIDEIESEILDNILWEAKEEQRRC